MSVTMPGAPKQKKGTQTCPILVKYTARINWIVTVHAANRQFSALAQVGT